MKKFNLFNEIITANKSELLNAINSSKLFGININGDICFAPFTSSDILIYQAKHTQEPASALKPSTPPTLETIFGNKYQIVEDGERVLIKAFSNWQELIAINTPQASYDDTTADGVAEFSNKDLEDIGWHATEFHISYRELVEVLEEKADGTVLCIEQEEPYQFSGFGFLSNVDSAKDILYKYCQDKVKHLIATDDEFTQANLEDDVALAAQFFEALV